MFRDDHSGPRPAGLCYRSSPLDTYARRLHDGGLFYAAPNGRKSVAQTQLNGMLSEAYDGPT